jgi:inorganic pyrophosphatase
MDQGSGIRDQGSQPPHRCQTRIAWKEQAIRTKSRPVPRIAARTSRAKSRRRGKAPRDGTARDGYDRRVARAPVLLLLAVVQLNVPAATLPASAVERLRASVTAAGAHPRHLWRDTHPVNDDGTVNGYVEIPRGDVRKFEFSMARQERVVDRVMPRDVGGYPVNYGFVPQTVSYDGDPFDVLVTGPPLRGGAFVRGVIVAILHMEDELGPDSKVVISPVDRFGRATQPVRAADQRRITDFFNRYKRHEPGKFSRVLGWGGVGEGRAYVQQMHTFYMTCADQTGGDCITTPSR